MTSQGSPAPLAATPAVGRTGRRLRLLQVTHDLGIGGLPKMVATLCSTIDRDTFDISVLCMNAKGALTDEIEAGGVPVHCLAKPGGGPDRWAAFKAARFLRRMRVDVLHTHNTQPFLEAGLGALLAGVRTHVHTDHGREFPDRWRYMFAERIMSRFAYRIVGVSDEVSDQLIRWEKLDPRKLVTIQNGIDPAPFDAPRDPKAVRAELGIAAETPVIGIVARFSPEKGVEHAIRSMPRVLGSRPESVLVLVGYGDEETKLRHIVTELGLDHAVRFLGARTDVARLMSAFDVSALPSLREGLPMFVLESLAAGCPIVASRVGGVPAALEGGESGLLVEPGSPDALADGILRLLADAPLRRRLAERGRLRFERLYSARAMARRYEDLYLRRKGEGAGV